MKTVRKRGGVYFFLKRLIVSYVVVFLTLGSFTPVYAQELSNVDLSEASESAKVLIKEATQSAVEFLNPEKIPSLRLPFEGIFPVSLEFGEKYDPDLVSKLGEEGNIGHTGVDFETPLNTEIISVDNGVVVMAEERQDFGLTVKISHAWGDSLYGHLKEFKVTVGQNISKDQVIGLSGSSGVTTGPHLHFGIKPKNHDSSKFFGFIDPSPYLGESVKREGESSVILSKAKDLDSSASASASARNDNLASSSAVLNDTVLGASTIATSSATLPQAENIATDSGYLFNYKFNLEKGTTAHFYDKATKRPSFAIANENYDYKLRFFLNQDASESAQPQVEGNKVEFPVKVGGIPMTLRYTISGDQVKEEFIIREKPGDDVLNKAENLNIPFTLNNVGLTMEKVQQGYEFKSKDGTIVWRIANATIEDSSGKKGSPEDAYLEIDDTKAVLGVKKEFLKNASYPVVIDPTWTQTTWDGGSGTSTTNQFSSSSSVTTSTAGQATLTAASSWYNTSWKYRRKITLANTTANLGVTAETLTNFPVLVKLDSTRVDYNNTQGSGQDIRFTDSDGTTLLSHEIEKWDETGSSYVWVKVPSIDTTGTDYIYAYYGNSGASDAQSATSVWDSSTIANWHFKESSGTTAADSTSGGHTGTWASNPGTQFTTAGLIGNAASFNGSNYLTISSPSNFGVNAASVSFWMKAADSVYTGSDAGTVISATNLASDSRIRIGKNAEITANSIIGFRRGNNANSGDSFGSYVTNSTSELYNNNWHYVVMTFSGSSNGTKVYVDGVAKTYTQGVGDEGRFQTSSFGYTTTGVRIGVRTTGASYLQNGTVLDQVSFANAARSAAWVAAEYVSQKSADSFNTYGSEEPQVATSGTLTSAIFDTAQRSDWGILTYNATIPSNTSVSVKARSSNSSTMSGATDFSSCTAIASGAALSTGGCVTNTDRYVQYQITLANSDAVSTPTFQDTSIVYSLSVPDAPTSLSGSPSTSSITWSWTDNSSDEDGFYVQDADGNTKCTVSSASTTTCTESSLSPNTSYTRRVVAYNASGNSSASSNASAITLSTAPTTSNITSNRSTSTWYNTASFTFTNGIGFGAGGVEYLRYAWDTSSTHTWSGSETQWTSGTLTTTATSDSNSWYLHLKGYNSADTENGTMDFGPFYYDATNPASVSLDSPGDSTYTSSERPTFKWKANSTPDATAGLSKYQITLVDKDSTQYILIDSIPTSRTTDYETSQYLIHYDGFSDSDSSNNYISIYTKTSSSWATGANDGKLKTGKNTWKVIAVDNAGNSKEESRTIYGDFAVPVFSTASIESVGEKDGYYITTNFDPVVSGTVTDDVAPDKISLEFYKFSYFLGVETGKSLNVSKTSSLSNSSDKTSMDFKIQLGQNIDGGKYELLVKGYDKAGNTTSQTIKFQLMNADQAKSLLDAEKLTDQLNQTSLSLVELEKKAKLRKEKEAAELEKLITAIKEQWEGVSNVIASTLTGIFDVSDRVSHEALAVAQESHNLFASVLAFVRDSSDFALRMTEQGLHLVASTSSVIASEAKQSLASLSQSLISANHYIDNSQEILAKQIQKDYGSLTDGITNNGNNAIASIVLGIENTRNAAINTSYSLALAANQQVEESIISVATAMKATGQSIQESGQSLLAAVGEGIKLSDSGLQSVNTALSQSQEQTQKQIALLHQTTSQNLQKAGEAAGVAWRSLIKPAVETKNFTDRVVKGTAIAFSTFQAYVFDKNPTKIANVTIEELGSDYMIVSWDTNHYTHSNKVNYGENTSYGEEAWGKDGEKHHVVKLTGLKPETKYFFEVMGQNKNYTYDAYYSFETLQK